MNVTVHSRKSIEILISNGIFPKNTAVISFYDPPEIAKSEYRPVDYSKVTDDVFCVAIPDYDLEEFNYDMSAIQAFFPEARELTHFIMEAHKNGHDIICQCDYGQSRSAGCAMAILEYFDNAGKTIFENPKYFPNQLGFAKVYSALKEIKNA